MNAAIKIIINLFVLATVVQAEQAMTLDDLKWKNRVIVADVSSDDAQAFIKKLKLLKDDIIERDIVLLLLNKNMSLSSFPELGKNIDKEVFNILNSKKTPLVLIGKDGFVKAKLEDLPTTKKLFEIIDAMPMRMFEMR